MGLEVAKRRCDLGGPRKQGSENLLWEQMFRRRSTSPHYNLLTSLFIWATRSLS
jgi:hypothetical protein